MPDSDTIKLLRECNSGIKMGVESIEDVLDKVGSNDLKHTLNECMEKHQSLGSETRKILNSYGGSGKEPSLMAKGMSKIKTELKTAVMPGDSTIADLITQGCDMGVKSLNRYLNEYRGAENQAKDLAKRLINLEEQLTTDVAPYL
ncbi:MAG: PA2169 family four-helix-bundle protein [Clostridiales bacterium]|nr:PA2169 family four-helix-bundle protein [Clostridiales bacterium]